MTTTKNDEARADRLKAALRENLKRRKVQVRGRADPATRETPADHAAEGPEPQDVAAPDEP